MTGEMHPRKSCLCLASFLCVFSLATCSGTAVVVIVTPSGIVIGADGKTVEAPKCGNQGAALKTATARKLVVLRARVALSDISMERAIDEATGAVLYDFATWSTGLNERLTTGFRVSDVAQMVKDEMPKAIASTFPEMDRYACLWDHGSAFEGMSTVEIVVAGYESGAPVIHDIDFHVDWKTHTVLPASDIFHQIQKGQREDRRYLVFAVADPRTDICTNVQSDAYKFAARSPKQRAAFCSESFPTLSLRQASHLVRFLLEVETHITKTFVGSPFTVVTIPQGQMASLKQFAYGRRIDR